MARRGYTEAREASMLQKAKVGRPMKLTARGSQVLAYWTAVCLMLLLSWNAHGQSCQTTSEIDAANKTAIQTTAQRYFDMASKGDVASLRQNAIASLASDFAGIEGTVKNNPEDLGGAQAAIKSYFLLDASDSAGSPRGILLRSVWQDRPDRKQRSSLSGIFAGKI